MSLKGNQISSKGTGNAGITDEKLHQFSTDLIFSLWFMLSDRGNSTENHDEIKMIIFFQCDLRQVTLISKIKMILWYLASSCRVTSMLSVCGQRYSARSASITVGNALGRPVEQASKQSCNRHCEVLGFILVAQIMGLLNMSSALTFKKFNTLKLSNCSKTFTKRIKFYRTSFFFYKLQDEKLLGPILEQKCVAISELRITEIFLCASW